MKRIRVIPVLLLQKDGLVKSVKFRNYKYVGDPINAVKIFNEKEVDEIAIIDIAATAENRGPDIKKIIEITGEAFIPLAYGGGISTIEQVKELINNGVEKVIINYNAFTNPSLITQAAEIVGSQSVVVSIDVKKNLFGKYKVYVLNGKKNTGEDPVSFARKMEAAGAGEIIINSIDRDGTFEGYDLTLIENIAKAVTIPVVALGGVSSVDDFFSAAKHGASAVAAGSFFVFQRPHRAVLISYPDQEELKTKVFKRV